MSAADRRRAVLCGLVGAGVGPSLTPPMHELEGARHGMSYVYRTVDLGPGDATVEFLRALLRWAALLGYDGLNVTHPVKQTMLPLLDALAPSARAVGAVNAVVLTADGTVGHNTDVSGFAAAMADAVPDTPSSMVLIGAGGAGSAVAHALRDRGVERLVVVDADIARARALAHEVGASAASSDDMPRLLTRADGVVNATPMGMADHPGTAVDPALLEPRHLVADIVYRPVETALLREARARGCRVVPGLGMAMHQAADAFEIFTGEAADRRAMLADLEELVAAEATGSPHGEEQGGQRE